MYTQPRNPAWKVIQLQCKCSKSLLPFCYMEALPGAQRNAVIPGAQARVNLSTTRTDVSFCYYTSSPKQTAEAMPLVFPLRSVLGNKTLNLPEDHYLLMDYKQKSLML